MSNQSPPKRSRTKPPSPTNGVVTFLDILGWKGIYNREVDPISKLTKLTESLKEFSESYRGSDFAPTIQNISDTIVIYTDSVSLADVRRTVDIHGAICSHAIANSIANRIPVRGATSFGACEAKNSSYVGKAIDEAASWYEVGDWIGVHLTPSAMFAVDGPLEFWANYQPPLKSGLKCDIPCANWSREWSASLQDQDPRQELQSVFREMGPITPDIAIKFVNTLTFFDKMRCVIPQRPQPTNTHPS